MNLQGSPISYVVRGDAGAMQRRPIGGAIADHWTWVAADADGQRSARLLVVLLDKERELWITPTVDGMPMPGDSIALQERMTVRDDEHAREVCRHLARNAAHGVLPMPPTSNVDRRVWKAAIEVVEAFIERYGILADLERERR